MQAISLMLALAATVIVLRSGDRIVVQGDVREENGAVMFRTDGVLYSVPARDVDRIIEADKDERKEVVREEQAPATDTPTRRLRVSPEERQRLIAELEKNRSGTPPPRQKILEEPLPSASTAEPAPDARDEMHWRTQARAHDEAVRRAAEELQLLQRRAEDLQLRIMSLMSLGFQPDQFTYDTGVLMRTRDQIPRAQLDLERAQRARDEFRETARKNGILPGWLR